MENLKKILNAQTRVFGNFQFLQHMARNHLVGHKFFNKIALKTKIAIHITSNVFSFNMT